MKNIESINYNINKLSEELSNVMSTLHSLHNVVSSTDSRGAAFVKRVKNLNQDALRHLSRFEVALHDLKVSVRQTEKV